MGLGALVNDVAGGGLDFLSHHGPGDAVDANLALVIGGVEAIAAQVAVVIVNVPTVGIGELELSAGN